jgi:methyl-accepting chemotaxis protein
VADLLVNTDTLRQLASSYNQLVTQLEQFVNNTTQDTSDIFPPGIGQSLSDFLNNWSYGVGKVKDHVDNVTKKLNAAASGYDKLDSSLVPPPTPSGSGSSG